MTTVTNAGTVGGRYRLVNRIASGGMGHVWRATDELLGRQVAVKILKPEFADDGSFRLRFRAEARASASLSHPGVATVYDYGEETEAGGIHSAYLVMELVPGEPLSALLAREGPIAPARAMDVVAQTARALQAAHDLGIVHRDVKPANLLVRPDGRIKITDFGIARAADTMALTQTGTILGTVAYMSPEQLNGHAATSASDLYSLGVVAYLCIAGRTPFAGGESMAVALAHVREEVPPLPDQVPPAIRDVVYQLLDKDPARRPESAAALATMAAPLSKQPPDVAVPPKATVAPTPGPPTDSTTAGELGRLPTRRSATATGAVTRVAATPLGRDEPFGAGATVAFPEPGLPGRREPHRRSRRSRRGARRRSRPGARWGAIAVLVGIAVLAVVVGLWASAGPSMVTVPAVRHSTVSKAVSALTRAGLRVSRHPVDGSEPPGRVVSQAPRGKTRVNAGSTVTLAVSSGYVDLPSASLIGQAYAPVAASISALGLRPSRQDTISSSPAGRVLAVTPGGRVQVGATIAVSVSVAPPPPTTTVPTHPTTPETTPTSPTTPNKHGQDGNSGQSHGGD